MPWTLPEFQKSFWNPNNMRRYKWMKCYEKYILSQVKKSQLWKNGKTKLKHPHCKYKGIIEILDRS